MGTVRPRPSDTGREAYRVAEVAAMTGLSVRRVYKLISDGDLEAVKTPGAANAPWLVTGAALARFFHRNRVRVSS
jgi:excisionase family DNA binding protein